jgi:hypothetical protein
MLWERNSYEEEFSNFYVTPDNKKLAIIGTKYHYVFSVDEKLQKIISWKHNNILTLNPISGGIVDKNNHVTTFYEFRVSLKDVSTEDAIWLKANNFTLKGDIEQYFYFSGDLSGTRYMAKNSPKNMAANSFENSKKLHISEDFSDTGRLARNIASPITILVDGTIILGSIPLLAISSSLCKSTNHKLCIF